ncbi:tetratricopeptide repeat protein, partial [Brevundimonas sp.]|uniref:tetratricopeptide repeat protein n=1 Tax=Brevundimonas sp. TaxID=1871086 RepID=UPI00391CEBA3
MMRLMGGATVVAVGVMLAPVTAQAQTPGMVNARVEISAAVAGSSQTLEAIERQANARDRARQAEIAALQTRLTEAEMRGAAELARLQAELIEAREALVADLAARDRAYADEIAVFRREVTAIASTAEGAAALARYNAGDRVGAIAVLDRLIRARDAARQTRVAIEGAAERRQVATLALDARAKSDPAFDTGAVIARFEEVVRLDPGEYMDWFQLVQLYIAAGRRADALAAAERLEALADNEQDRSVALTFTADILRSEGDRAGALSRYQRSLEIVERLSAADPASADLAREVSVSLNMIGDVLLSEGDRAGALSRYQRSLEIWERLSAADPASAHLARGATVPLDRIGDVLLSEGDRAGALSRYQRSLDIAERLSAADPASADLARDVSVSLNKIGDVLLSEGDRAGALSRYQRSLEIRERLSAADPASA